MTPGHAEAWFNFRNSPASPSEVIKRRVKALLEQHDVQNYEISWRVSGEPFRSDAGQLRLAVVDAIRRELGIEPMLNTGGGTSDGRFIAPLGTEVIELGLLNESIHKVDENTSISDLDALCSVYRRILDNIFLGRPSG